MADIIEVYTSAPNTVTVINETQTIELTQGVNLTNYATIGYVETVSGVIVSQITGGGAGQGVSSIEGLTGIVDLLGTGSISILTNGQSIILSGSATSVSLSGYLTSGSADLTYYRLSNPSGFITGLNTGQLTNVFVTPAQTGNLTNVFYPLNSNPNNYVNTTNTGALINSFALKSETGQFTILRITGRNVIDANFTGGGNTSVTTGANGFVYISGNTGAYANFVTRSETGALYNISGNIVPNTVFVSPSGNNSSALRARRDLPFRNLANAREVTLSGDSMIIGAGTYYEQLVFKNGVNYLAENVTLQYTGLGETVTDADVSKAVINDSSGAAVCNLYGKLNVNNYGRDDFAYFMSVGVANPNSNIYMDLGSIRSNPSGEEVLGIGIRHVAGKLVVDCKDIYTSTYDGVWCGLFADESINTTGSFLMVRVINDINAGDQAVEYSTTQAEAYVYARALNRHTPAAGFATVFLGHNDSQYTGEMKIYANKISHGSAATNYTALSYGGGNMYVKSEDIIGNVELGGASSHGSRRLEGATVRSNSPCILRTAGPQTLVFSNGKMITNYSVSASGQGGIAITGLKCFNVYTNKDIHANVTQVIAGGLIVEPLTE